MGQLFYLNLSRSALAKQIFDLRIRSGYWNHLYNYVDVSPLASKDALGLGVAEDIAQELFKEGAKKEAGSLRTAAQGNILGLGCIAQNCRGGVRRQRSYIEAYGDCTSLLAAIMRQNQAIVPGMQISAGIEAVIDACASNCSEALKQKNCCGDGAPSQ